MEGFQCSEVELFFIFTTVTNLTAILSVENKVSQKKSFIAYMSVYTHNNKNV